MVFNLFYIFRAKARKEKQRSRVDGWRQEIAAQFAALETGGAVAEEHKKRLARRLPKIRRKLHKFSSPPSAWEGLSQIFLLLLI